MDPTFKRIIRPPWVEFILLDKPEDFKAYAYRIFMKEDPSLFKMKFGINIFDYKGFWAEVGNVQAPVAPVIPATERVKIKPIFTIRMSNRGRYYVVAKESSSGFINRKLNMAWINVDEYEEMLGDRDFFESIEKKADALVGTQNA